MKALIPIGTFAVNPKQRERFVSGKLWQEWHDKYSEIFDDDDLRLAERQPGYHFYEWLAAILIHHSIGYLSLVEKYQYTAEKHKRKEWVLKQLNSPTLSKALEYQGDYGYVQCPDLLVYERDFSDWYFCEVKGGRDKLTVKQERHFQALADLTKKPVRLVEFSLARKGA